MKKLILTLILVVSIASPAHAQWTQSVDSDEMTGEVQAYATSPTTKTTKPMSSPYSNTVAWIGFGCDGKSEWAFIGFSHPPNLTNKTIEDGYNSITTRVKWDAKIGTTILTQKWGAKFVHFRSDEVVIEKMLTSNKVLIELEWYGSGSVYFPFSLSGSTKAINSARQACGK